MGAYIGLRHFERGVGGSYFRDVAPDPGSAWDVLLVAVGIPYHHRQVDFEADAVSRSGQFENCAVFRGLLDDSDGHDCWFGHGVPPVLVGVEGTRGALGAAEGF